jgi:hypothetical protein
MRTPNTSHRGPRLVREEDALNVRGERLRELSTTHIGYAGQGKALRNTCEPYRRR